MLRSAPVQFAGRVFTAALFGAMAALFICGRAGRPYGVTFLHRARIVWRILRLAFGPAAVTLPNEQLYLVNHILRLPTDARGDIAEFGCFKGRTSAILSLACKAAGRRLVIFDTFAGLPGDHDGREPVSGERFSFVQGTYNGTLEEVRETIQRFGDPSVCVFVEGPFARTLPDRNGDQWAMVFEDADLPSSVRDVLLYAWPALRRGGSFFSHEARDPHVIALFFDAGWWKRVHNAEPPQFVGSGTGLPLGAGVRYGGGALSFFGSFLGYAIRQ